ncbi:MAG: hypothetical protein HY889_01615 [Deltaproteobacteria bacterium]|nr:hypothetical protein [Deltaproteobacteria bacterium]
MKKSIFLFSATILFLLTFVHALPSEAELIEDISAKEQEQLKKFAPYVKRDGNVLRLRLKSGSFVTLSDSSDCTRGETCALYQFVDYYKDIGFYLVFIGYYEGFEYSMISDKSGEKYMVPAFPEFSPDRKRFVSVSANDSGYNENGVFVDRFEDDGIVPELSYRPFDPPVNEYALYRFIEWKDSQTVLLDKYTRSDRKLCPKTSDMTYPVILKLEKGEWKFHEDLSSGTVKCGPNVID